jgi:hypothetical protein
MSTTTQDLRREQWVDYFHALACRALMPEGSAPLVTVEVIGERPDNQQSLACWRLRKIGYRAEDDVIEIAVRACSADGDLALRLFIAGPRAITLLEHEPLDLTAMVVDDASGIRTSIRLFAGSPASSEQPRPGSRSPAGGRAIRARRVVGTAIVGRPARARGQARCRVTSKPNERPCVAREARRLRTSPRVHRPRRFP